MLGQLEREGSLREVEYSIRTREGGIVHVLESARPARDESGAVVPASKASSSTSPRRRATPRSPEAGSARPSCRRHCARFRFRPQPYLVASALDGLPPGHPGRCFRGAGERAITSPAGSHPSIACLRAGARCSRCRTIKFGFRASCSSKTIPPVRQLQPRHAGGNGSSSVRCRRGRAAALTVFDSDRAVSASAMSGEELARRLKSPILSSPAHSSSATKIRSATGFRLLLPIPASFHGLFRRIHSAGKAAGSSPE